MDLNFRQPLKKNSAHVKNPPLAAKPVGECFKSNTMQKGSNGNSVDGKMKHILYAGHGSRIAAHLGGVFGFRQSPGSVRIETFK